MQRYFGDQYMLVYRLYQGMMGSINADEGAGLLAYDLQQALKAYPDAKILAFTGVDGLLPVDGTLAARMQEVLAKSDEQLCPIVSLCGEWEYDGTFAPSDAALGRRQLCRLAGQIRSAGQRPAAGPGRRG